MIRNPVLVSRRKLLAGLTIGGGAAAVAMAAEDFAMLRGATGAIWQPPSRRARPASLATAEMDVWMAEVGTWFLIGHTRMRLAGIQPRPRLGAAAPAWVRKRPFIALFDVPSGEILPGNLVYTIRSAAYPPFDIFLDEPAPEAPGRLRAVFN